MSRAFITRAEAKSELWERLREGVQERIELRRTDLESTVCSTAQTDQIRGELIGLRWLLALERAPQDIERPGDRTSLTQMAEQILSEGGTPD